MQKTNMSMDKSRDECEQILQLVSTPGDNNIAENCRNIDKENSTEGNNRQPQLNKEADLRVQEPNNPPDTGLLNYLENTTRGKEIKEEYSENNNLLLKNTRSKLARLVIQREKDWAFRNTRPPEKLDSFVIKKSRFLILSQEIASIFENENALTYYSPGVTVNKLKIPVSGKLYDHYIYEKERLRKVGILANLKKRQSNENIETNIDVSDKLEYLKTNIDDWDIVTSYWEDTYKARRHKLTVEKVSTLEFINNFRCLQIQRGLTLITSDFFKLHPNKSIVDQDEWTKIKTAIKQYLKSNGVAVQDQGLLHTLLSGAVSGDKEDFFIFHLLPYIISSQRSPKSRKRTLTDIQNNENRPHKLSIQERRETFILHVMTHADVEAAILGLKEKLLRSGQTFQPLIVAVGEITNILQYFVLINDQQYEQSTCLVALSLALQIFFVFDCQYPENSSTLWLFVQKCLFQLHLPTDRNNISLTALLGYIERIKERA